MSSCDKILFRSHEALQLIQSLKNSSHIAILHLPFVQEAAVASSRATQLELDLASQLKELQVSQEDQRQLREREGEITQKLHTSTERPKTNYISFPPKMECKKLRYCGICTRFS